MPKIVSHSVAVDDNRSKRDYGVNEVSLSVYYCICGQMVFVLDSTLEKLPRRPKDNSFVVDLRKRTCRRRCVPDKTIYLKRTEGLELQIREKCQTCGLPLLYKTSETAPFFFVLDGAVSLTGDVSSSDVNVGPEQGGVASFSGKSRASGGDGEPPAKKRAVGSTAVSTMEEEEEESDQKIIEQSYQSHARVVDQLWRKTELGKTQLAEQEAIMKNASAAKRQRGTLIDRVT
eukprot:scpid83815/ scgid18354/ UPF0428 protein CXorf56 homolog